MRAGVRSAAAPGGLWEERSAPSEGGGGPHLALGRVGEIAFLRLLGVGEQEEVREVHVPGTRKPGRRVRGGEEVRGVLARGARQRRSRRREKRSERAHAGERPPASALRAHLMISSLARLFCSSASSVSAAVLVPWIRVQGGDQFLRRGESREERVPRQPTAEAVEERMKHTPQTTGRLALWLNRREGSSINEKCLGPANLRPAQVRGDDVRNLDAQAADHTVLNADLPPGEEELVILNDGKQEALAHTYLRAVRKKTDQLNHGTGLGVTGELWAPTRAQ